MRICERDEHDIAGTGEVPVVMTLDEAELVAKALRVAAQFSAGIPPSERLEEFGEWFEGGYGSVKLELLETSAELLDSLALIAGLEGVRSEQSPLRYYPPGYKSPGIEEAKQRVRELA
jgi:hypothetical protein